MKVYPCIFSTAMVQQLLAGNKTQTRRMVTSQWSNVAMRHTLGEQIFIYVREAFCKSWLDGKLIYKADMPPIKTPEELAARVLRGPYKPSIHMPRKASRLTLELTDIRLQQLRDITDEDAVAEGFEHGRDQFLDYFFELHPIPDHDLFQNSPSDNPDVYALSFKVHRRNIDESA